MLLLQRVFVHSLYTGQQRTTEHAGTKKNHRTISYFKFDWTQNNQRRNSVIGGKDGIRWIDQKQNWKRKLLIKLNSCMCVCVHDEWVDCICLMQNWHSAICYTQPIPFCSLVLHINIHSHSYVHVGWTICWVAIIYSSHKGFYRMLSLHQQLQQKITVDRE